MVTGFFKLLIKLGKWLVLLLPTFDKHLPSEVYDLVKNVFSGIGYFLPIGTISAIVGIQLGFLVFKFVYNMVSEVKEWTPGI